MGALKLSSGICLVLISVPILAQQTTVLDVRSVTRSSAIQALPSGGLPKPEVVEVFSNSAIYLTNATGARVYLLDGLEQLDAELSHGLPNNEREAQAVVQQRLSRIGPLELARRTQASADGIVRAAQYGIDRVPAVVFDGRAVVYGVTDVDAARDIFRRSGNR